jgi:hypothetical protein
MDGTADPRLGLGGLHHQVIQRRLENSCLCPGSQALSDSLRFA